MKNQNVSINTSSRSGNMFWKLAVLKILDNFLGNVISNFSLTNLKT